MNVLFLDFDGPLFPDRIIKFHPDNRKNFPGSISMPPDDVFTYWRMDPMSVLFMNTLVDLHPFKTVVSSSWKRFLNKEQIVELFKVNDLVLELHEDHSTPDFNRSFSSYGTTYTMDTRAQEIEAWLKNHEEVSDYMILDDMGSGASLDDHRKHCLAEDRILMVDQEFGISTFNQNKMLDIVCSWEGIKSTVSVGTFL